MIIPKTQPKPCPIVAAAATAIAADADIGAMAVPELGRPPSGMSVKASEPLPALKKATKHGTTVEKAPAPAANDGELTTHGPPPLPDPDLFTLVGPLLLLLLP